VAGRTSLDDELADELELASAEAGQAGEVDRFGRATAMGGGRDR